MLRRVLGPSLTRVVLLLAALAAIYFLVTGGMQALRTYQMGQEAEGLEKELQQLQERYRRLEALYEYLDSDEYIEGVAREQLGLVRPGEKSIIVLSTAPTTTPSPAEEHEGPPLWWESLVGP